MNKPVAWRIKNKNGEWLYYDEELVGTEPLYAHPAKTLTEDTECQYCKQGCIRCDARKLLTDEEIWELHQEYIDEVTCGHSMKTVGFIEFARAILKKASEK